jgi:homoserine dehydrogenase
MIARASDHRAPFVDRRPASDGRRTLRIGLLGCGTVGSAVARLLVERREHIRHAHGVDLILTRVLVRDAAKLRTGIDPALLTCDVEQVLRERPDVIIEALGGREPAATCIERTLHRGISVVSANKTVIAHDGPRLQAIAQANGARLEYEASVGAAIPVLAALRQRGTEAGDPIISIRAVVNGTCNFVLSRIRETGQPLEVALKEAIERGYAEPDPTADISGRDSAEKLCILARAAGLTSVTPADIQTTGIAGISPRDVDAAREQGCVVRLIAELDCRDDGASLRVCPMFVPQSHPLAKARGAENVFVLEQQHAGRLVLQGEGAGPAPTARPSWAMCCAC